MSVNLDTLDPETAMRSMQRQRAVKMVMALAAVVLAIGVAFAFVALGYSDVPEAATEAGELAP